MLQGRIETDDGTVHPEAVARVRLLIMDNSPDPLAQTAIVAIEVYHDLAAKNDRKSPLDKNIRLNFTVGGSHPFEQVFNPIQNAQQNLFLYLKNLPEFQGWMEV